MLVVLVFWLMGALIGVAAAQKRGFSVAAGVIGGLLLGPLAFLMFFISGVTRTDQRRKCPQCAEFGKAEARLCKHCHRTLVPQDDDSRSVPAETRPFGLNDWLTIAIVVVAIALVLVVAARAMQ
jgi:hypothetical protein